MFVNSLFLSVVFVFVMLLKLYIICFKLVLFFHRNMLNIKKPSNKFSKNSIKMCSVMLCMNILWQIDVGKDCQFASSILHLYVLLIGREAGRSDSVSRGLTHR